MVGLPKLLEVSKQQATRSNLRVRKNIHSCCTETMAKVRGTLKLWSIDDEACVLTFEHGEEVQTVGVYCGGTK